MKSGEYEGYGAILKEFGTPNAGYKNGSRPSLFRHVIKAQIIF
jgi:hypothetical protein